MKPIKLDGLPSKTTLYDTSLPNNGAPGLPGEIREYEHPDYGIQWYRPIRASGSALSAYAAQAFAAGSNEVVAVAGAAARTETLAGIPQAAIADGYWGWALVRGQGLANTGAAASGDSLICAAAGALATGTTAGQVVGRALEAGGAGKKVYLRNML